MTRTKPTWLRLLVWFLAFAVALGSSACGNQIPAPDTTQPKETTVADTQLLQPTPIGHNSAAYPLVFLDATEGNCQAFFIIVCLFFFCFSWLT